jgi:hypothetical protein
MTPCLLLNNYWRVVDLEFSSSEGGDTKLLRNVANYLPVHRALEIVCFLDGFRDAVQFVSRQESLR